MHQRLNDESRTNEAAAPDDAGVGEAVERWAQLREAYRKMLTDMVHLECAGLLDNHIHNRPNLRDSMAKLAEPLNLDRCGLCLHRYFEHVGVAGRELHCCDGCNGFVWEMSPEDAASLAALTPRDEPAPATDGTRAIRDAAITEFVAELTNTLELMHDCDDEGNCDACQTIIHAKDIADRMKEETDG
jgi:hypothetical protein